MLQRLQAAGLANVRELRPLVTWSIVLVVAAWQPFDVTLEVGTVATKIRSLQAGLWQYSGLRDEGLILMVTALFAMSLAAYLAAVGVKAAGRKAAGIAACVVVALEGSQILITSRMPSLWDAIVGAAGVAAGAMLWSLSRRLQWRSLGLSLLVLSTAVAAAMAMLSPFEISPEYHTMGWFPLLSYYSRTTFEALSHVFELVLLYFPLGYCFTAGAPPRRRLGLLAVCLALAVAAPVEALQGWVIGRYPDVSDVALSLAGVWLGVQAARTDS
jgi:VanZ family protein